MAVLRAFCLLIGHTKAHKARRKQREMNMGLQQWFARQRRIRSAIRELNALDDRRLFDLGIARHEIEDLVAGRR